MSMPDHGISRLNCVCRCASGFWSVFNPAIHILAGENVCIQAISPTQASLALASRHRARICSAVVTTGLKTTRTGMLGESFSA